MVSTKHWKLELLITLASLLVIPLLYYVFTPFFGQIVFVPLLFGILPLLLVRRYHFLIFYPFGAALSYSIFLLLLSWTWPLDWGLISLAFGSVFIPTLIGYGLGFLYLKFGNPQHKWIVALHCLTSFVIIYLVAAQSLLSYRESVLSYWYAYLFIPLIFIVSQGLISYLYPSNRISPLISAVVFQLISGFTTGNYLSWLTLLYIGLAYLTMYLILIHRKTRRAT